MELPKIFAIEDEFYLLATYGRPIELQVKILEIERSPMLVHLNSKQNKSIRANLTEKPGPIDYHKFTAYGYPYDNTRRR